MVEFGFGLDKFSLVNFGGLVEFDLRLKKNRNTCRVTAVTPCH